MKIGGNDKYTQTRLQDGDQALHGKLYVHPPFHRSYRQCKVIVLYHQQMLWNGGSGLEYFLKPNRI
jgi:hypothetical protein